MKLNWAWGLAILYICFVILVIALVVGSNRQNFDLVSNDYYGEEIAYQKVLDGGKNQAALSAPISIVANTTTVTITFPGEFKSKSVTGNIQFYSPVHTEWDKNYPIKANDLNMVIDRTQLRNTKYTIKITCTVDGKSYYQESDISLI